MRIHVVAVAGTGMGALAGLLGELGHDVSGSDVAFDPPMGPALLEWGIECLPGFDAKNLEQEPDLVVIGNVCRKDNVEARTAIDGGMEYTHIAGALRRFALEGCSPLVVAGTHGKTTTSSLTAWLLDGLGFEPGFLVGGIPKNFGRSFRAPGKRRLPVDGGGERHRRTPFVVEGDEYDTAFFEKTAKFLHYLPEVAIVTSIEHDHIDIYPTKESYVDAFEKFVASVPESGLLVANAADQTVVDVVNRHAKATVAWYALQHEVALEPPHWLAAPATMDARGTSFDLFAGGVFASRLAVPMSGEHNLKNTLAAIAAACQGFGARLDKIGPVLAGFQNVKRRQDLIGEPRGIFVYDDFAHHPTAVRETLGAFRSRHPGGKLFAVFEPRSATACRNLHQAEYTSSFGAADAVLLAPLGRSGLADDERLDTSRLVEELRAAGTEAHNFPSVDTIVEHLVKAAAPGDTIALLSNGAFGGIHSKLVEALE